MFDTEALRSRIVETGAVLEGDFFFSLKSRAIATKYINLDAIFPFPGLIDRIGDMLLQEGDNRDYASIVAAPATGAIPLAYATARALRPLNEGVRVVWADKKSDGKFVFERMNFAKHVYGKKVIVVEDIATTGGSAKAVADLIQSAGGTVHSINFVWNRGDRKSVV